MAGACPGRCRDPYDGLRDFPGRNERCSYQSHKYLYGVCRNWIRRNRSKTGKLPCFRLYHRKDLYRKAEKRLCTRTELLLLPRCYRSLSYWLPAGSRWQLELQICLLRHRFSDLCRCPSWPSGMRFSLPLRPDPGSFT